jgi:hypothetical protein
MNVFSRAYRAKYRLEWKKLPGRMVIPALLTLFVCILPMYMLYTHNTEEMPFGLILGPIAISSACGLGLLIALTLILRKPFIAGLWSAAIMAVLLNFSVMTSVSGIILPFMDTAVRGIVSAVIVLAGVFFLIRLIEKKNIQKQLALIVMAFTGFLFLINTINIIPALVRGIKEMADGRSSSTGRVSPIDAESGDVPGIAYSDETEEGTGTPINPDIYLFIMDEYADFVVFEKYYDDSEKAFQQFLINTGFNISYSSYCNSLSTPKCIADLVNLAYVSTGEMTDAEARNLITKDAALHTALQSLGYSLYQVSTNNSYFRSLKSLREPEVLAKVQFTTETGQTVEEIAAGNSILSIFHTHTIDNGSDTGGLNHLPLLTTDEVLSSEGYSTMNPDWKPWIRNVLGIFDFYQNSLHLDFVNKTVIYSYICCPHVPFLFNSDGSILHNQRLNWADKAYYAGQHRFVSRRLQPMVTSMLHHNPNCIIILQSDHGIRTHTSKFRIDRHDAYHIFNAVYFCGRKLDIEGKSALNTLRLILTKLGEAGYPQVDDPVTHQTVGRKENDDLNRQIE